MWILLFACGGKPAAAPPAPVPKPASVPDLAPPDVKGHYVSDDCGQRTYARHLWLAPDGTYRAEDHVSPCPEEEGIACVWEGILRFTGTWLMESATQVSFSKPEQDGGPELNTPWDETLVATPAGLENAMGCVFRSEQR